MCRAPMVSTRLDREGTVKIIAKTCPRCGAVMEAGSMPGMRNCRACMLQVDVQEWTNRGKKYQLYQYKRHGLFHGWRVVPEGCLLVLKEEAV